MNSSSNNVSGHVASMRTSLREREDHLVRENSGSFIGSQGIYHILFELAPDAMVATDHEGRILELNAEVERQFGYRRDELIGQNVEILVPHRFRAGHLHQRKTYQASPGYCPMNRRQGLCALRKDGSEFPVDISLAPVLTENGTVLYGIIRDTSERVAAQGVARRLQFEQALAGLSAKFINLPADRVDEEITSGLRALVEALDSDCATLSKIDAVTGDIQITHTWARAGLPALGPRLLKAMLPWLEERIRRGEPSLVECPSDLPTEAFRERDYMESIGKKSSLVVPFRVAGTVVGGMSIDCFREYHHWDEALISRVQDVTDIFANALSRKQADEKLQVAYAEIEKLREHLEWENSCLREEIELEYSHSMVVGNSSAIRNVLKKAEQVAHADSTVLVLGETGTGKELIARTIHQMSGRNQRPMVTTNCAALPATLIESELFGREKGAYTGALAREIGRFELANQSTIFLDEIGELPPEVQAKLLRVLQEGEFERLGSSKTIRVDVRVIAATSRDLQSMIRENKFREDLFYRLNVFPIPIPPLRERVEDIPVLVWHFLKELGKRMGRKVEGVHAGTMQQFQRYAWPGNVRELRNVIERNLIVNTGAIFRAEIPKLEQKFDHNLRPLNEIETDYFRNVLQATSWRIRGKGGAAEILGLKPTTLEARMKKLNIHRPA
jgi:PAS domain S-box-containing protein